jgi:hypothetical protein
VTLFGRYLFDYEKTFHQIYDISSNTFYYPLAKREELMWITPSKSGTAVETLEQIGLPDVVRASRVK